MTQKHHTPAFTFSLTTAPYVASAAKIWLSLIVRGAEDIDGSAIHLELIGYGDCGELARVISADPRFSEATVELPSFANELDVNELFEILSYEFEKRAEG